MKCQRVEISGKGVIKTSLHQDLKKPREVIMGASGRGVIQGKRTHSKGPEAEAGPSRTSQETRREKKRKKVPDDKVREEKESQTLWSPISLGKVCTRACICTCITERREVIERSGVD